MFHKIVIIADYENIPKGSVIQECNLKIINGENYWSGMWSSMIGTFNVWAPENHCEIWDEEKHDPTGWAIKKHFEEKARQARLSPVLSQMCNQLTKE